jgi:replication factor C subunit 3/5
MSDYEDEMDIDAPSKVQFTSDNASGKKRTAADLPIAAQDNLPWYARHLHSSSTKLIICIRVEKYRPNSLDDVSGHQDILATINRFIEANVF